MLLPIISLGSGDADKLLFTWGFGSSGQIGDGATVSRTIKQIDQLSWASVTSSKDFKLAIRSDGLLFGWGKNNLGQLGNNDSNGTTNVPIYTTLNEKLTNSSENSWVQFDCGISHSVGIKSDGSLWAWGGNAAGQVGNSTSGNSISSPVKIGSSSWSKVSAGDSHTLAIDVNGRLFAWGLNGNSQLGVFPQSSGNKSSPVQVGTSSWSQIAAGGRHSAALTISGQLYIWGFNEGGAGSVIPSFPAGSYDSPILVTASGISSWSRISAGSDYMLAIAAPSAMLYSWGNNSVGQLGDGTTISHSNPQQVNAGINSWSYISTKNITSFGIQSTDSVNQYGTLYGWGSNNIGQIGDGTTITRSSPTQITTVSGPLGPTISWKSISAGYSHSTAIGVQFGDPSFLFTWGKKINTLSGDTNTTTARSLPTQIPGSWTYSASGNDFSIASEMNSLPFSQFMYSWGGNNLPQATLGREIDKTSPTLISSNSWSAVHAGNEHVLAIRNDGKLFAWGIGVNGQLGTGTTLGRSSPVQVGTSSWSQIAAGLVHSVGITSDRRLFAWGDNAFGKLGDGTTISKSSPVQIGTSSWARVSTSYSSQHTLGITSDLRLFAWGRNNLGQLGDSSTSNRSSPIQIGTSSWVSISAGALHSLAISANGALWSWGDNSTAQLGNGSSGSSVSSPIQIGTNLYFAVSAAVWHSVAVDSQNRLYTWGTGLSLGELGDNFTVKASPIQIGNNNKWSVNIAPTAAITTI